MVCQRLGDLNPSGGQQISISSRKDLGGNKTSRNTTPMELCWNWGAQRPNVKRSPVLLGVPSARSSIAVTSQLVSSLGFSRDKIGTLMPRAGAPSLFQALQRLEPLQKLKYLWNRRALGFQKTLLIAEARTECRFPHPWTQHLDVVSKARLAPQASTKRQSNLPKRYHLTHRKHLITDLCQS
jgi:hypothetical protein